MVDIFIQFCAAMSSQFDCTINTWCIDYYIFAAINAYRSGDYAEFCKIRDVLQSLVALPLESSETLKRQLLVMQFLSRINDGDKLDLAFDSQDACTPLESALSVLFSISQELEVPQPVVERIQTSICETLVILCMKNKMFVKAEEIVTKHLPNSTVRELLRTKRDTHQRFTYEEFRKSMLDFSESLFTNPEPFLYKAVKGLAARKQLDENRTNNRQPTPQDVSPVQTHTRPIGSVTASVQVKCGLLKDAFGALNDERLVSATYAQLEQEVRQEVQWENALWDAEGSASAARPCTMARLVMEEDSELDSAVSQENPAAQLEKSRTGPAEPTTQPEKSEKSRTGPAEPAAQPENLRNSSEEPAAQPEKSRTGPAEPAAQPENLRNSPAERVAQPEKSRTGPVEPTTQTEKSEKSRTGPAEPAAQPENLRNSSEESAAQPEKSRTGPAERAAQPEKPQDGLEKSTTSEELVFSASSSPVMPYRNKRKRPAKTTPVRYTIDSTDSDSSLSLEDLRPAPPTSGSNRTRRKLRMVNSRTEMKEDWSDADSLFSVNGPKKPQEERKFWTEEEAEWIRQGVVKYGEGCWAKIRDGFPFRGRTSVNIKDKWRTMRKARR
ncbi:hypothetical protein SKAU_G00041210 [Synaphobranchus kaupii]|uniref:Telomeric repeat-binding factor n=1 Tax=Synaphobranchus kaupii TaxID=118154 RepID=A0A9Q1G1K4_SYNKA|nr:hypothetical protein SKAU_G00041210 [Synaphobranchus kaupii]